MILIDTREHKDQLERIKKQFDKIGETYKMQKLDVGDYMDADRPDLVVDRKHNLAEIAANFTQDRFLREMQRAKQNGIKLVFLVEHSDKIKTVEDVLGWVNPRLGESPLALSGERIYRKMKAFEGFYSVSWEFCRKQDTGKRICAILGGNTNGDKRICPNNEGRHI